MNRDEIVTGTVESITSNESTLFWIKLVGDDNVYLMPRPVTVTLHRQQDHYEAVMRAEFVAQPDEPPIAPSDSSE